MVLQVFRSGTLQRGKSKQSGRFLVWVLLFAFVSFFFTLTIFNRVDKSKVKRERVVNHLVSSFKSNVEKDKLQQTINSLSTNVVAAQDDFFFDDNYKTNTNTNSVPIISAESPFKWRKPDPPPLQPPPLKTIDHAFVPEISFDPTMPRLKPTLDSADFPSLLGSTPASLNCASHNYPSVTQTNMDNLLVYWNEPQGEWDRTYVGKFDHPPTDDAPPKYVTFEPDRGGWNNIRMSMETVLVFAYATNRILVMPPKKPFYLVGKEGSKSYDDFFHFNDPELKKHITIISMNEYLQTEGGGEKEDSTSISLADFEWAERLQSGIILEAGRECKKSTGGANCEVLNEYLRQSGYTLDVHGAKDCFIFGEAEDPIIKRRVKDFCVDRKVKTYNPEIQSKKVIHFSSSKKENRLLTHFYEFLMFTDPKIENHYKRFIRDFAHYKEEIICASTTIVSSLQTLARSLGFEDGQYSTYHVRRGDFQYKNVKIPAEEIYQNTKDKLKPNELLFFATDEHDTSFFNVFKEKGHTIRFLDDFSEVAKLEELNMDYFGMVDSLVAATGRNFFGTWFSTFTGYITRLRGYLLIDDRSNYFFMPQYKNKFQDWVKPHPAWYSREFPTGWYRIDSDEIQLGYVNERPNRDPSIPTQKPAPLPSQEAEPNQFKPNPKPLHPPVRYHSVFYFGGN